MSEKIVFKRDCTDIGDMFNISDTVLEKIMKDIQSDVCRIVPDVLSSDNENDDNKMTIIHDLTKDIHDIPEFDHLTIDEKNFIVGFFSAAIIDMISKCVACCAMRDVLDKIDDAMSEVNRDNVRSNFEEFLNKNRCN